MHLYETHLPVKDTEVSSRFYVDVVGLEFADRDLTRDIVFLWVGSNKRSMLVCGVQTHREDTLTLATLPSPFRCPSCLRPVHASAPSASSRGIFRGRLQPNHRSSAGCRRRSFTSPIRTDTASNTSRCLTNHQNLALSVRFRFAWRGIRWFNRVDGSAHTGGRSSATPDSPVWLRPGSQSWRLHSGPKITMTWRSTRAAVCAYVAAQ